ncbi:hypothetical protein [Halosimplex pelagicum]|uniref:Transglutaminase-like domain-containing protein n=1 Tax=Halosimplex pelagicum TaxID=869886 RepID=A0A7D5PBB9_9EURY|nr:hypothetical protein [Halosimplex pelagicum]QLH82365.1 hypothetical protein HZS54_12385 [Halosimplex pelagicum]
MAPELSSPNVKGLAAALQDARCRRLKDVTGETDFGLQEELGGRCTRNAYTLAKTLEDHGFSPVIICGGFADQSVGPDGVSRSELPTTIADCRDESNIHYWVETEYRTYTLDLAGEFPTDHPLRYSPFIARSVPRNYYYLEDGINYTFDIPP